MLGKERNASHDCGKSSFKVRCLFFPASCSDFHKCARCVFLAALVVKRCFVQVRGTNLSSEGAKVKVYMVRYLNEDSPKASEKWKQNNLF